jgi:tetratricopeptide (TPR) repeat protein
MVSRLHYREMLNRRQTQTLQLLDYRLDRTIPLPEPSEPPNAMSAAADRPAPRKNRRSVSDLLASRASSDVGEVMVAADAELSVEAHLELARQAQELGLPHHALLHLEAVEPVAPDRPGLAKAFGRALLGIGMVTEALAKLEQAVVEDPDDREGWLLVAALREERGDHEGCMGALLRAMLLGADAAPSSSSRPAPSGARSKPPSSNRAPGRTAADGTPLATPSELSRSPAQVLRLADALLNAGSVLNAEKLFARQLPSPLAAQAHLGLARCACARGQYSQALPHLRAAQRLEPGHPDLRGAIHALLAAMAGER